MASKIEETLKHCSKCKKTTIHHRATSTSSALMIVIHIFLILATMGLWLILLIIWKVLNTKIGGWHCKECGN